MTCLILTGHVSEQATTRSPHPDMASQSEVVPKSMPKHCQTAEHVIPKHSIYIRHIHMQYRECLGLLRGETDSQKKDVWEYSEVQRALRRLRQPGWCFQPTKEKYESEGPCSSPSKG